MQNLQQPLYYYSLSLCIIFTIEIIAITAHATCSANENHAFLGNRLIAINIAAIRLIVWYRFYSNRKNGEVGGE